MADKGIRPAAIRKFGELLPTRAIPGTRTENAKFRAEVNTFLMEQFAIPMHSAATAYNHAFLHYKALATGDDKTPANETIAAQLVGLGRPEDKKGGRKKKEQPQAAPAATPEGGAAAGEVLQSNILGNGDDDGDGDETPPAPKVKVVQKNGKGTPQEFDTVEQAQAYMEANSGQFKPKLMIAE